MKKILVIILLLPCMAAFAQNDRIDSLLNDLIFNDTTIMKRFEPTNYDFIYTGINYNNKTFFAGREVGSNLININGSIYYFNSTGLFAGISGIWYDQLTPGYSTTAISLGYGHSLGRKKHLRLAGSYSRFIYTNKDSTAVYPYENNVNLSLSFQKKWYGASVSTNLLFGSETLLSIVPSVYTSFYFGKFGNNNQFHLGPEISCYLSKETINESTNPVDVFGLLNTQIDIPISINLGNFELQLGYSLNIPYTQDSEIAYEPSSAFSVSAFYLIPIAKYKRK